MYWGDSATLNDWLAFLKAETDESGSFERARHRRVRSCFLDAGQWAREHRENAAVFVADEVGHVWQSFARMSHDCDSTGHSPETLSQAQLQAHISAHVKPYDEATPITRYEEITATHQGFQAHFTIRGESDMSHAQLDLNDAQKRALQDSDPAELITLLGEDLGTAVIKLRGTLPYAYEVETGLVYTYPSGHKYKVLNASLSEEYVLLGREDGTELPELRSKVDADIRSGAATVLTEEMQ